MEQGTTQKILGYISRKGQASGNELALYLGITPRAVRKQLAKLVAENHLYKVGKPPKVFYLIKENGDGLKTYPAISPEVVNSSLDIGTEVKQEEVPSNGLTVIDEKRDADDLFLRIQSVLYAKYLKSRRYIKIISRNAYISTLSYYEKFSSVETRNRFSKQVCTWLKSPIFWARFFAYAIPLTFLLYVLYMNFLPFGYNKTFVIDVGGPDDTKSGEFYLEPSKDLSERKVTADGITYRELNGSTYAVFKPKAVLKNAKITVSVIGDGVSIIPPVLDFDPSIITDWDYDWDFTREIPKELTGDAFVFDGATYFDGTTRLEFPDTANGFENRAFSVYVEWEPRDSENNTQQIIGHFNWEIWQNKDSVTFQVGRMNDAQGPTYSIKYPITAPTDFFNKKHTVLAIYNPSLNGYIELFIDGNFAGRTYFGADIIWTKYGDQNLSFGWTPHNNNSSPYFVGSIHRVNTVSRNVLQPVSEISLTATNSDPIYISIISTSTISTSTATSTIRQIKLNAVQR